MVKDFRNQKGPQALFAQLQVFACLFFSNADDFHPFLHSGGLHYGGPIYRNRNIPAVRATSCSPVKRFITDDSFLLQTNKGFISTRKRRDLIFKHHCETKLSNYNPRRNFAWTSNSQKYKDSNQPKTFGNPTGPLGVFLFFLKRAES